MSKCLTPPFMKFIILYVTIKPLVKNTLNLNDFNFYYTNRLNNVRYEDNHDIVTLSSQKLT